MPRPAGSRSARTAAAGVVREFDVPLLWVSVLLLLFGLVMVYSASIALPDSARFASLRTTHHLFRHGFALAVGFGCALFAFAIPVARWQKLSPWLFAGGLVLLVLVLVPGIGKVVLGARRWISFGVINLQPSELMKLFVILYAADYAVRKQDSMHELRKGFAPMAVVMALIGLLLLLEPDLGAFMVIAAVAMGLLFLGGVSVKLFAGLSLTMTMTFLALIWASPWRRERIFAYLDPFDEKNALGKGYQLSHSLIAFGRGEWLGVGLGGSVEKWHYLPEAHTDFLLAVIGEELGLLGVMTVIVLFFWLVRRCFEIGRQAIAVDRHFAGLVSQGVGLWIGVQGFINMGVNLGLLPTKGLTLPLMSYGGSGIMVNCVAIAIVLRIDFETRRMMRGAA
ncbi:MAG TPA: putative lipid II flippase FtsW [Burkholderiaceae bacterium]|nr:putative lipid II flippase FtsW [Burkholderiaceae bacterium]